MPQIPRDGDAKIWIQMKRNLTVIIVTILCCLGMLEAGLRLLGRVPTNMADGIAEQWGDSFRLKKSITKVIRFPAFTYTVRTNNYGFRDKDTGPKSLAGKPFHVFLGASDVFGNGVDFEDSFVGIFAQEAAQRGSEVLNLAVGGHFFLDQEALLKDFMEGSGLTPTTIFFCLNALHIPKFDLRNKNIIVKNGYILDRDGWQLTYVKLLIGNMSSAFCFFRDGIRRIQERYFHYEANEKSPEFLQVYDKGNRIRQPGRLERFRAYLHDFESFCRSRSIDLVYVYLPLSDSFNLKMLVQQLRLDPDAYDALFFEELVRSHCVANGLRMINPRPALERLYSEGKMLRFKLDPHFNGLANRIIGDHLIETFFGSRPANTEWPR